MGDMERAEHEEQSATDFAAAINHATQGVKTLRRWVGDKTFEGPLGLAAHHLYLATKRIGAGAAHLGCVPRDDDTWESLNDSRNVAESRVYTLSRILGAANDVGEDWINHEKEWSDIREPMRTAEPWIFEPLT